ncbi:GNAT family N-acetyltransferase [Patulibacter defluvii]|uniref:GNAT family N-acetyltransferase n=1 Tax=Patulibacter defluvii TaxID=3095358 RepID=UPI002A75C9F4|nr:GNAT family protein [Patulibacter sp. DM4]
MLGRSRTPDPAAPAGRVTIRPPRPEDAPAFLAAMRASVAFHAPWATPPTTQEAFADYLRRCDGDDFAGFLLHRHEDGALVGYANLSQLVHGPLCSAYLGYNAVAGHEGRGYLTEGVAQVLLAAFGPLRLHRVEANIQPGNDPSLALARRLGLRREGFSPRYLRIGGAWRDHERWALLADEPAAERLPALAAGLRP